ncbi:hypothetical protein KC19_VG147500 [Ceratodon purpureus]|uniref:Uncharacterized protein n=1 Tax=Ceratodon purpureus TaxID=3225 RepID=A0A8T0HQ95_CERPU|nr:hypothetical protein KC19_VG147500 [Ceratodon purpureus]
MALHSASSFVSTSRFKRGYMVKLVRCAMQCSPNMKGAACAFIVSVTPFVQPWNKEFPSATKHMRTPRARSKKIQLKTKLVSDAAPLLRSLALAKQQYPPPSHYVPSILSHILREHSQIRSNTNLQVPSYAMQVPCGGLHVSTRN